MSKTDRDLLKEQYAANNMDPSILDDTKERSEELARATAQKDQTETRRDAGKVVEESRKSLGNVDFSYSKKYQDLKSQLDNAESWQKAKILAEMTTIKTKGTITPSEKQKMLDSAIALPLDQLMSEHSRLIAKYNELGEKIKGLSVEEYQKSADEAAKKAYKKYQDALRNHPEASLTERSAYQRAFSSEKEKIYQTEEARYEADKQALMIEMWETNETLKAHEMALSKYISENSDLISQEMEAARRAEIRGSLRGLAELIGTDDSVLAYLENAEELRGKAAKALSGFLRADRKSANGDPGKESGSSGDKGSSHGDNSSSLTDAQWEKYLSLRAAGIY